jgi:uncharacterized protein YuzE
MGWGFVKLGAVRETAKGRVWKVGGDWVIWVTESYLAMKLAYDTDTDLLCVRFDPTPPVQIVLDLGADDKIVSLEILDASEVVKLASLLPVETEQRTARAA